MKPIKWPNDYNRPLSKEEQQIARRLDRAPDKNEPRLEIPPREYFNQE